MLQVNKQVSKFAVYGSLCSNITINLYIVALYNREYVHRLAGYADINVVTDKLNQACSQT